MQESIELTPGLAGRLEELRVNAGLSRPEFAKMVGVAEATIWRMETSKAPPPSPSWNPCRRQELM